MTRIITPSKLGNPWATGTDNQPPNAIQRTKAKVMATKIERNRRQLDLPEIYGVRLELEPAPGTDFMPRFATVNCPVITASKKRDRILVIAPDGTDQWVDWKGQRNG